MEIMGGNTSTSTSTPSQLRQTRSASKGELVGNLYYYGTNSPIPIKNCVVQCTNLATSVTASGMVNTRNSSQSQSQQQSQSQTQQTGAGVTTTRPNSSDESEDEVLDVIKRKQESGRRSSKHSITPTPTTNDHSHDRGRDAHVDVATTSSAQRNNKRKDSNVTSSASARDDPEVGLDDFDQESSDVSPCTTEDDDFLLDESHDDNDDEQEEMVGQRRSQRQMEKQNISWMAMKEPSANGYRTRAASSAAVRYEPDNHSPTNNSDSGRKRRMHQEEANGYNEESQDLYTRTKTHGRPRVKRNFTSSGTSTYSPRKLEPIASRLRARNPKSYNLNRASRRSLRQNGHSRRSQTDDSASASSDEEEIPRKRQKAIMISNDGSQQLSGGIEGFEPIKPDTTINFSSVGGLDDFIQKIREVILFPMLYKPFYENRRITPPRGLLLYGPPGTGKTLLARAVAGEATRINGKPVSFFMLKGSEVQTKWVGESEKALRELFKTATNCQPSIIFFDEFDGLAAHRSIKTDQFHNSLVSTFLAELDGLRDRGQIIVIGATNRVEAIDPAFRRAGRLDFELQFRLPDYNARREIITIHTKDWPDAPAGREMEELASLTAGYNGADLKLICSQACLNALKRRYPQIYKRKEKLAIEYDNIKVSHIDFVQALEVVPRSSFRSTLAMTALPLPELLKPLLQRSVDALKAQIGYIFQIKNPGLISPARKRILIFGDSHYIVPAALYTMDSLAVSAISTQSITLAESEARAILAAFSEATVKRGILYIQDIDKVYKMLNPLGRLVLHQELNKVDDVSLVLATSTDPDFPEELVEFFDNGHFKLLKSTTEERHEFFHKIFAEEAYRVRVEIQPHEEEELEVAEVDDLSEKDLQDIEKHEDRKLRGLRIFLREMLQKLARNRKFSIFAAPVDTEEAPDYFEVIQNPMDFEKMMRKINNGDYLNAKMFLGDIELIALNALEYNPERTDKDKQIRLRAFALRDEAKDLIDREMDSDFELDCQRVAADREERKRRVGENQIAKASKPVKASSKGKKSSDNSKGPEMDDDLGFRTTPNAERYKKQLDGLLGKFVRATENSSLLEMTALRFKLSCACQKHFDSEDKEELITEVRTIVHTIDRKKSRPRNSTGDVGPLSATPSPGRQPAQRGKLGSVGRIPSFVSHTSDSENDNTDLASTSTGKSCQVQRRMSTNGHL